MGGVAELVERARSEGLSVSVDNGKLVVTGPKRCEAVARELLECKADVLAWLNSAETPDQFWERIRGLRWGAGLEPGDGIELAVGWRWSVATLPQADWTRWRSESREYQLAFGRPPEAGEIRASDEQAACDMGIIINP